MPKNNNKGPKDLVEVGAIFVVELQWKYLLIEALHKVARDHGATLTAGTNKSDPEKTATTKIDRANETPRRPDEPRHVPTAFLRLGGEPGTK